MGQEGVVDLVGVLDVIDGEVVTGGFLGEPDFGGVDEGLVDAAGLSDGEDVEARCGGTLSSGHVQREEDEDGCNESGCRSSHRLDTA